MNPYSPRPVSPFCTLLLLLAAPVAAQDKVTLRYNLKPGTVTWIEQTSDMKQVMTPPGGAEMKTAIVTSMWLESKVKEVKDGVATIEQRYARVKAKSDSPMMMSTTTATSRAASRGRCATSPTSSARRRR